MLKTLSAVHKQDLGTLFEFPLVGFASVEKSHLQYKTALLLWEGSEEEEKVERITQDRKGTGKMI